MWRRSSGKWPPKCYYFYNFCPMSNIIYKLPVVWCCVSLQITCPPLIKLLTYMLVIFSFTYIKVISQIHDDTLENINQQRKRYCKTEYRGCLRKRNYLNWAKKKTCFREGVVQIYYMLNSKCQNWNWNFIIVLLIKKRTINILSLKWNVP